MIPVLNFTYFIVHNLIWLVIWLVTANAILSWLVAFGVINVRNRIGNQLVRGLDNVTGYVLRPLRRFIPPLGGMDFTPIILTLVLIGADRYLVVSLFAWLSGLVAPQLGTPL